MADTKISALTAAGAAADANELAINEAGTSKKVTAAQLKTLVNTAPVWAAGSASAGTWPKLTTGTKMTTPEAGAFEMQDDVIYGTPEAGNRGVMNLEHWIRQAASRALTSTASEQKLFDSVTNGTLNLAAGVYFFECMMYLTGMSASSGNLAFDILGAGTAALADVLYHGTGFDVATPTNPATATNSFSITGQSAASILTAGTAQAMAVEINGTFEVTTAGTIIPSVTLVTAAAATLAAGTYFKCHRVGPINAVSVGDWS